MDEKLNKWLESATVKLLVGAFSLGVIFSEFRAVEHDLLIIERRLDKKIKILNEVEKRVRDLEACKH